MDSHFSLWTRNSTLVSTGSRGPQVRSSATGHPSCRPLKPAPARILSSDKQNIGPSSCGRHASRPSLHSHGAVNARESGRPRRARVRLGGKSAWPIADGRVHSVLLHLPTHTPVKEEGFMAGQLLRASLVMLFFWQGPSRSGWKSTEHERRKHTAAAGSRHRLQSSRFILGWIEAVALVVCLASMSWRITMLCIWSFLRLKA